MPLTPEEQAELQQLEMKFAAPKATGLTASEQAELDSLEKNFGGRAPETGGFSSNDFPSIGEGLQGLAKALDYGSGIGRTAVGGTVGALTGKPVLKSGDVTSALQGSAVPGEELLNRMGVPEGAHVNLMPEVTVPFTGGKKIGVGDTSMRDVAGLGLEAATDPLTYLSLGGSQVAKGLRPVAGGVESLGENIYKSGLKKVDEKLLEKGTKPVSDILLKEGVWGTNKSILEDVQGLSSSLNSRRQGLLDLGDQIGIKTDPAKATASALEEVKRLKRDPGLADLGASLEEKIKAYRDAGPQTLNQTAEWKTNLYNALPEKAYDKFGKVIAPVKNIEKKLANGFKTQIEDGLSSQIAGGGEKLAQINSDLGALIAAKKPLNNEIKKANTKNWVSSVDMGLGGYAVADPVRGVPLLVAKKLGDLGKTTYARTGAGLGVNRLGSGSLTGPAMDALSRRAVVSPWLSMKEKK